MEVRGLFICVIPAGRCVCVLVCVCRLPESVLSAVLWTCSVSNVPGLDIVAFADVIDSRVDVIESGTSCRLSVYIAVIGVN